VGSIQAAHRPGRQYRTLRRQLNDIDEKLYQLRVAEARAAPLTIRHGHPPLEMIEGSMLSGRRGGPTPKKSIARALGPPYCGIFSDFRVSVRPMRTNVR
jgi:hypothetical protein